MIVQQIIDGIQPHGMENNLIGIESHLDTITSLLYMEATNEVRMVGVYGMGGIGKTTIAQTLFTRFAFYFEGSSFVKDIKNSSSSKRDICNLQEKILGDILAAHEGFMIQDPQYGANMIRERFYNKKVLLVLDDVDDFKQLQFLAARHEWFGPGSRIIITTRDEHLLFDVNEKYKPALLTMDQAVELFSMHAFRKNSPPDGYKELTNRAIHYAGGLPLALAVLGSFFYGRQASVWGSALDKLAKLPNMVIFEALKLSYDALDMFEKKIFLDIACFFKGKDQDHVTRVLDSFGFHAEIGIRVLVEKSLITVSNNKLDMHDLIQEMGWKIVRESSPNSRLWQLEDVHDLIKKNQKLKRIEAIVVTNKEDNVHKIPGFSADVFENMKNLRLLDVNQNFTTCEPTIIPDGLRWLCWNQYPFSSLPLADMCKLVGLEMHGGDVKHLWKGQKIMWNLKFIHLQHLECLIRFPDVSEAPNIERLVLTYCTNLVEVHQSLVSHKTLVYLDMSDCWKLKCFPPRIEMESLETLIFSRCYSLEQFPEITPCMVKLSSIYLDGCPRIEELPSSINYLCRLGFLNLTKCTSLKKIPNSICELKYLKSLHLQDCVELLKLPEEFGSIENLEDLRLGFTYSCTAIQGHSKSISLHALKKLNSLRKLDLGWRQTEHKDLLKSLRPFSLLTELNLSGNSDLTEIPASIYYLSYLKLLELNECCQLQNLHSLPPKIQVLRASGCRSLEKIEDLVEKYEWLYKIWLVGCWKLPDQKDGTNLSNMLQLSFLWKCAAIGHRLSIAIPGSKIPSWFNAEQHGCNIALKLLPRWHSHIMGFTVSGVFDGMCKMISDCHCPVIKFTILNDGELIPKTELNCINDTSVVGDDINSVWIGYIPFSFFQQTCDDWSGMEGTLAISVSLKTGQLPVKCGAHIVYKEDVKSIQQVTTCIPDYCNLESLTRKGNSFIYEDEFWNTLTQ